MRLFATSRQGNGDSRSIEDGKAYEAMIDRLSGGNLIGIYGDGLGGSAADYDGRFGNYSASATLTHVSSRPR